MSLQEIIDDINEASKDNDACLDNDGICDVVFVFDKLLTALHDAIDRPKGVVPDSAIEFYDPEYKPRKGGK